MLKDYDSSTKTIKLKLICISYHILHNECESNKMHATFDDYIFM